MPANARSVDVQEHVAHAADRVRDGIARDELAAPRHARGALVDDQLRAELADRLG